MSYSKTKLSRTLLNSTVRKIGLSSLSTDLDFGTFAKGKTSAHFHSVGSEPSLMDALKIDQMGPLTIAAKSLRSQFGIPSGPGMRE